MPSQSALKIAIRTAANRGSWGRARAEQPSKKPFRITFFLLCFEATCCAMPTGAKNVTLFANHNSCRRSNYSPGRVQEFCGSDYSFFFVATVIVLHGLTVDVIWPLTTARGGNCSKSRPGNWERSPGPGESPRVLANGSGKKSAAISLDIAISEHICCVQCAQTFF